MKAVLCKQFGPPESLVLRGRCPRPAPAPGEVVISIKAASVNFPDVLIIQNKYQFKPPLPFSPGSELAGVVKEVGEGVANASSRATGDRVHHLRRVRRGSEDRGRAPAAAARGHGVSNSARGVPPHLRHLRPRAARPRALQRGRDAAGAGRRRRRRRSPRSRSARRSARASSPAPPATRSSRSAGSTAPTKCINYATEDLRERIKALTGGKGVDVIYDPVGGPYTEPAFRSIAWRGRLLVIGFAAGDIPKLPLNLPLLKGASVVGVFWGDFTRREPQVFGESVATARRWYPRGQAEAPRLARPSRSRRPPRR